MPIVPLTTDRSIKPTRELPKPELWGDDFIAHVRELGRIISYGNEDLAVILMLTLAGNKIGKTPAGEPRKYPYGSARYTINIHPFIVQNSQTGKSELWRFLLRPVAKLAGEEILQLDETTPAGLIGGTKPGFLKRHKTAIVIIDEFSRLFKYKDEDILTPLRNVLDGQPVTKYLVTAGEIHYTFAGSIIAITTPQDFAAFPETQVWGGAMVRFFPVLRQFEIDHLIKTRAEAIKMRAYKVPEEEYALLAATIVSLPVPAIENMQRYTETMSQYYDRMSSTLKAYRYFEVLQGGIERWLFKLTHVLAAIYKSTPEDMFPVARDIVESALTVTAEFLNVTRGEIPERVEFLERYIQEHPGVTEYDLWHNLSGRFKSRAQLNTLLKMYAGRHWKRVKARKSYRYYPLSDRQEDT